MQMNTLNTQTNLRKFVCATPIVFIYKIVNVRIENQF